MLQNPQVASMLTPFHHAAAMQAAALHHAAASQNNPSGVAAPPTDSSVFNTSLSAPNSARDHHTGQSLTGSSMPHLTPLTRMSPPGHPQKEMDWFSSVLNFKIGFSQNENAFNWSVRKLLMTQRFCCVVLWPVKIISKYWLKKNPLKL